MIAISSDHAGFALKKEVEAHLDARGIKYKEFGATSEEAFSYAVAALGACNAVVSGDCERAILICGTGIGISMAANKVRGIRAACCSDHFSAKYTRLHNDANALCFGARVIGGGVACELVDIFLDTAFEGGRHAPRVDMIMQIEKTGKIEG